MKRTVILATFFRPYREIIAGEEAYAHPSFHRASLLWLEAGARADPDISAHYDLTVESFDQDDPLERSLQRAASLAPAVVALSCHMANLGASLDFCRRLRLIQPEVKIVLGGPEVCDYAYLLDRHAFIDAIVLGEGEVPFTALLRAWIDPDAHLEPIPSVALRHAGRILVRLGDTAAPALSTLRSPYGRELFEQMSGIVLYATSRGCPHSCSFCRWQDAPQRFYPVEQIERELDAILSNPEVKAILFSDAGLDLKSRRTRRLLRFIRDHNPHGIKLRAFLDFLRLDEEGLQLSREAGFLDPISIGLQSASARVLELAGRRWYRLDELEAILPVLLEFYPATGYDVIYGLPGDDYESFKRTLRWCLERGLGHLVFHRLMVVPGTELYTNADRYGLVFDREPPHYVYASDGCSYAELLRIEALAESFQVVMSVLGPSEYEFLQARRVDLIEVMERVPSVIPDWNRYFGAADENYLEGIDSRVLEPLLGYIRTLLGHGADERAFVARLAERPGGRPAGSPRPLLESAPGGDDAAIRVAEQLIRPCRPGQEIVEGWTLVRITLDPHSQGGATYVFEWEGRPIQLKIAPRDDTRPRLDHSRNYNIFYAPQPGDEGIPNPRRDTLFTAFVLRIRDNDKGSSG